MIEGLAFWIISEEYFPHINEEGSVGEDHWVVTLIPG